MLHDTIEALYEKMIGRNCSSYDTIDASYNDK
jgi:hypothetical protein